MSNKRNVILADCAEEEIKDVLAGLEKITNEKWYIESRISNWGRTSKIKELKRYIMYFIVPFCVFLKRKNYEKIVGWQQFYALIFCFFCEIFHVKKTTLVHAVNYTYKKKKGVIGQLYYYFMKKIANSQYLDYLYVPSHEYAELCAHELNMDKNKIVVLPFGVPDLYQKYKDKGKSGDYALAIGRSNRDYDWLIEEWQEIKYQLNIISDTYRPNCELPDNIKIIKDVSGEDQFPYIAGCRFMVLPIKDGNICSGDTVLLTALSFKKTVILNKLTTLAEMYIIDGKNGLLVDKTKGRLHKCVKEVIDQQIDLGEFARKSYLDKFSRYNMGVSIAKKLLNEKRR